MVCDFSQLYASHLAEQREQVSGQTCTLAMPSSIVDSLLIKTLPQVRRHFRPKL